MPRLIHLTFFALPGTAASLRRGGCCGAYLMLARSFDRASKSTIDASVGAQEFVDAIRDATRNFYRAPKVLAASTFAPA